MCAVGNGLLLPRERGMAVLLRLFILATGRRNHGGCPMKGIFGNPSNRNHPTYKIEHMTKEEINNERKRIGERITQLRKEEGLTQADLAERTGITQANISRIEQGYYSIRLDILTRIARALNCEIHLLSRKHLK